MWYPGCGADIVHDFHRMAAVVYYHRPRKAPSFRTEIEEVGGEAATDGVPFERLLSILYILSPGTASSAVVLDASASTQGHWGCQACGGCQAEKQAASIEE